MTEPVFFILIGRNEGDRLLRSIASLPPGAAAVYVDSGSTDGSPQGAGIRGLHVIELDRSRPFSAGRARNAGAAAVARIAPHVTLLQFIDGDCELNPRWVSAARCALDAHPEVAVVCGRRRERDLGASIYHRLMDMEWNKPSGKTDSCGGDAMFRRADFERVNGFDEAYIAGEEPELCARLRSSGREILRIDAEMTLHDADICRFSQWWRRSQRAGFELAAGALRTGGGPSSHWKRQVARTWLWAVLIPVLALVPAWPTHGLSLLVMLVWVWPIVRSIRNRRSRGDSIGNAWLYAVFCFIGKWAELSGQLKFLRQLCRGATETAQIIEYKSAPGAA